MGMDGSSRAKGSRWEKLLAALHGVGNREEGSSTRAWPGMGDAPPGPSYSAGCCTVSASDVGSVTQISQSRLGSRLSSAVV